jgi:ketosteroid isomerase-like protein
MRNPSKLPALAALALAITACQGGSGSELTVEDLAVIRQVTNAWQYHVGAADWESLMVVYTPNAVVMPPNGPTLHGHNAIKAFMAASPPITDVSLTIEEIDGSGKLAFVRGTYTMTLEPEGAAAPVQDRGKYVEIRRKQADGAWLIAVDIFNSDLPIPQ